MSLDWREIPSPLDGVQMWGAVKNERTYVISLDTACLPSEFLNRYTVSTQYQGVRDALGIYDTLEQAQAAAEGN